MCIRDRGVSLVFFIGSQIGTPLFVWLFYGDLYESVKGMMTVVNLSQILGVLSAYLFIVVLTFTEEKWQLILQIIHLVIITAPVSYTHLDVYKRQVFLYW